MQKNIIENLSNDEYHSDHKSVSNSMLKILSRSPAALHHYMINEKKQSDAMIFGSAFHKFILERDDFEEEFIVAPKVDRRTKEGKAAWLEFLEQSKDKNVITIDEFFTLQSM